MSTMNRLYNSSNAYQGEALRVLCVCSAGLLRSPTAAVVLAGEPWNHNTRAAGLVEDYALIYADDCLLQWADQIVCMTEEQMNEVILRLKLLGKHELTNVICLHIPDNFKYRDPQLIKLIKEKYIY